MGKSSVAHLRGLVKVEAFIAKLQPIGVGDRTSNDSTSEFIRLEVRRLDSMVWRYSSGLRRA